MEWAPIVEVLRDLRKIKDVGIRFIDDRGESTLRGLFITKGSESRRSGNPCDDRARIGSQGDSGMHDRGMSPYAGISSTKSFIGSIFSQLHQACCKAFSCVLSCRQCATVPIVGQCSPRGE